MRIVVVFLTRSEVVFDQCECGGVLSACVSFCVGLTRRCLPPSPIVRVLAFEPRKENIKGAENGKLFAICSGTGNHSIGCSKSSGVPRSLVMTIRRHSDPSPGELSSIPYEKNGKFL